MAERLVTLQHTILTGHTFTGATPNGTQAATVVTDRHAFFAWGDGTTSGLFAFDTKTEQSKVRKLAGFDAKLSASVAWTLKRRPSGGASNGADDVTIMTGTAQQIVFTEEDGIWILPGEALVFTASAYGVVRATAKHEA